MLSITLTIIIITVIVSLVAFNNGQLMDNLIFYPPAISEKNQYYRFISNGFIHADAPHLFFNMYALYLFGEGQRKNGVEYIFSEIFGDKGKLLYMLMYLLALTVCLIPTYEKHKTNHNYRSLGASGAIGAVVFTYILFDPMAPLGIIFIPVFIPGFLLGILYLVVSFFLDRKGGGNMNHSAHIWGSLFGVGFVITACKLFSTYPVMDHFIQTVRNMNYRDIFTTY